MLLSASPLSTCFSSVMVKHEGTNRVVLHVTLQRVHTSSIKLSIYIFIIYCMCSKHVFREETLNHHDLKTRLLNFAGYGKRRGSVLFKAFRLVSRCGATTMSEQESLRCSSARNRGGVQRVEGKLRASVEKGDYYEAHQMYRTLFFR